MMLGATVSWSTRIVRLRPAPARRPDVFVTTVYEMLGGGAALVVAGLLRGEGGDLTDGTLAASFSPPGSTSPSQAR